MRVLVAKLIVPTCLAVWFLVSLEDKIQGIISVKYHIPTLVYSWISQSINYAEVTAMTIKTISAKPMSEGSQGYYEVIPGTNWTMFDIKKAHRTSSRHISGVVRPLSLAHIGGPVKPTAANRTSGSHILIYNRVPKCGSQTMKSILKALARRNNFTFDVSTVSHRMVLTPQEEDHMQQTLSIKGLPYLLSRHFYILDFSRHPDIDFDWVNFVRDPVSRYVSMFHYLRSPTRWQAKKQVPPQDWFDKDLDSCVQDGDLECQVGAGWQEMQLSYFCGSSLQCSDPVSKRALQLAKYNLEHRYSVVGVLESLATSLAVLENRLPSWFLGAAEQLDIMKNTHRNSNPHPTPLPATLAMLRQRLTLDLELYQFAQQRLALQNRTLH